MSYVVGFPSKYSSGDREEDGSLDEIRLAMSSNWVMGNKKSF